MTQSLVRQDNKDSLAGLLLPLSDRLLLVPNSAIAELIPYRRPEPLDGLPAWVLGQVAWRDLRLPLLSFEAAAGGETALSSTARIAVINALGGRDQIKFLALLLQGIPHSIRIDPAVPRADVELTPLELDAVTVGAMPAKIPDLAALEQLLVDTGIL